ncbi:MYXO-CTERM sorting domain-containing protein [Archangium minus]|uniref:MYXO-CTERM sorting domain-containing protein n=1 Tax=Archangium minus TaxID=83450 RepID=A0ABY9WNR7_9BACT|nr:MYXO-CTERM sorting domain-containing protein [Archangium minus]
MVAKLAPGATFIDVQSASGFTAGQLILVHQTTGLIPVPTSGSTTSIDLDAVDSSVGSWELARVSSVSGNRLVLTQPLIKGYAASVSQVVHVPEYTTVQVSSAGTIVAKPWDGSTGGIVAFLVQGTLSNAGTISASGAGFRGGAYVQDSSGAGGCSGLDEIAPKGAQRGEGIALAYGPTSTGRGNVSTGGGGGVCLKSGGGGGGNWGRGGQGGFSHSSLDGARNVGGQGGARLLYNPEERFLFGGGGGAGHGADGKGGAGGNGGGVVFIRANLMLGAGTIAASGGNAQVSNSLTDGGSGAGAGGSIHLRLVGQGACSGLEARGGRGASTNAGGTSYVGPGGGGSGGYILYQATSGAYCPSSVSLGFFGQKQDSTTTPYDVSYGATAGQPGTVFPPAPGYTTGYITPSKPTVLSPSNGKAFKAAYFSFETTGPQSGNGRSSGYVACFVNGTYSKGVTRSESGTFQGSLGPLGEGSYVLEFAAVIDDAWSEKTAPITVYVDLTPPGAPVVTAPGVGSSLNNRTPTISGTAEVNSTVHVFINDSEVGTTTASTTGAWNFVPKTALGDGEYRVKARAVDAAGNESTDSAVRAFSVDATAPVTTITEAPPSQTEQTSATFNFSSDDAKATFQCRLDDAAFAPCESPYSLSDLSAGTHTVEIRAQDTLGNVESPPVRHTWTIAGGTPDGGGNPGTPDGGGNPGTPDGGGDPGNGNGGGDGGEEEPSSCGCSSPAGDPSAAVMVLMGLAAFVSRRRRK